MKDQKIIDVLTAFTGTKERDWKAVKKLPPLSAEARKDKAYRNKKTGDEAHGMLSLTGSVVVFVYPGGV